MPNANDHESAVMSSSPIAAANSLKINCSENNNLHQGSTPFLVSDILTEGAENGALERQQGKEACCQIVDKRFLFANMGK
jgi:hypothetical protein